MLSQAADNSLGEKSMNISGLNYTKSEESNPYFWPQLTAHFTATNCMQMQLSPTKASSEWQLLYQQDRWYKGKSVYSLPHAKSCPFRSWRDWTPRSRNHSSDQAVFSWKKKKYRKEKSPRTYTFIATSFSFSMLIPPLTSLPLSGALNVRLWYSKQL